MIIWKNTFVSFLLYFYLGETSKQVSSHIHVHSSKVEFTLCKISAFLHRILDERISVFLLSPWKLYVSFRESIQIGQSIGFIFSKVTNQSTIFCLYFLTNVRYLKKKVPYLSCRAPCLNLPDTPCLWCSRRTIWPERTYLMQFQDWLWMTLSFFLCSKDLPVRVRGLMYAQPGHFISSRISPVMPAFLISGAAQECRLSLLPGSARSAR